MNCPLCSSACAPMPSHPEAELFRCLGCSHAFTQPESIRSPERYEASYFEEDHRRWFEHPNTELFERILAEVPKGASVVDVGCGRGDFLRFARNARPDLNLTGIDGSLLYEAARLGRAVGFRWPSIGCTRCITCITLPAPRSRIC
jgi:SAM-dependent methyltransferase